LISIPIFILGLDISLESAGIKRKELYFLTVSSFIYFLFYTLLQILYPFWNAINDFSLSTTFFIGDVIGQPLFLGQTVSGLLILFSFVILYTSLYLTTSIKLKYILLEIIIAFILWVIFIFITGFIGFQNESTAMDFHYILFILLMALTIIFFVFCKKNIFYIDFSISNFKLKNYRKYFKKIQIWILILTLIFGLMSFTIIGGNEKEELVEGKNILFCAINTLGNWKVPMYGSYGEHSYGMYGLIPYYLNKTGYNCKIVVANASSFMDVNFPKNEYFSNEINFSDYCNIIESPNVTSEILDNIDIFVIINPGTFFSYKEYTAIWNFVEEGGSFLVLGDHTDVGGIQKPLNSILRKVDIKFNFDSALPTDPDFKWEPCLELKDHQVNYNVKEINEIRISVGASLDISATSKPVLVGKYGLSDTGDRRNVERAYLGDYTYTEGEQLGDIVISASCYYGNGKVLVFGDTSSFQNPSLPMSYPFVSGVFNWLKSERTSIGEYIQIFFFILLITTIFLSFFIIKSSQIKLFTILIIIILLVSMLISCEFLNPKIITKDTIKGNIAYIDLSHQERINQDAYEKNSVNGLMQNLMRNDYIPLFLKDFTKDIIKNSKIIVLNAPTNKFSNNEVDFIIDYISSGGLVILAAGYEDKNPSVDIIKKFDLDILNIPLGPVPYVEDNPELYQQEPRFVDAYPIKIGNSNKTESFYKFNISGKYYNLMTFTRYGKGGLLLIGDSQFLYNKNIETLYTIWPGNIEFIRNIITEIEDRGVLK
jgi:hypothetical protein